MQYDLVLAVPQGTANIDKYVDETLAPYNMLEVVEPYEKLCDCVLDGADSFGHKIAEKELGINLNDLHEEREELSGSDVVAYATDYYLCVAVHAARQIERLVANPDCPECNGTGKCMYYGNKVALWDNYHEDTGIFKKSGYSDLTVDEWLKLLRNSDDRSLLPWYFVSSNRKVYARENLRPYVWEPPYPKPLDRWKNEILRILSKHDPDDILIDLIMHW